MRALGVLGSALIAMTLATGSASATIVDRHNESGPYEFTAWDCGYPMQVEGVFSDDIQVRADKKNGDIVYVTTRHSFKETWTAQDGRSFTLDGHNLYKDVKAKRIAGQLYAFTFQHPGPAGDGHGLVRQGHPEGPRKRVRSITRSTSPTARKPTLVSRCPDLTRRSTSTCASSSSR